MKGPRKAWFNRMWRMSVLLTRTAGLEYPNAEISDAAITHANSRIK